MQPDKFRIEHNYCDCHPETCCCNAYKVVTVNGKLIGTRNSLDSAKELVKTLMEIV